MHLQRPVLAQERLLRVVASLLGLVESVQSISEILQNIENSAHLKPTQPSSTCSTVHRTIDSKECPLPRRVARILQTRMSIHRVSAPCEPVAMACHADRRLRWRDDHARLVSSVSPHDRELSTDGEWWKNLMSTLSFASRTRGIFRQWVNESRLAVKADNIHGLASSDADWSESRPAMLNKAQMQTDQVSFRTVDLNLNSDAR